MTYTQLIASVVANQLPGVLVAEPVGRVPGPWDCPCLLLVVLVVTCSPLVVVR
jgi:hypothetical protein